MMGEISSIFAKRSEANKNNSDLQTRRINRSGSKASSVDRILYLQRTIGNQAVSRLIRSKALQAKLRIGQPGDVYEQEADRVADEVMRMPEPGVQRQVEPEEEEEEILQTKPLVDQITPVVQREVEEEEEEMLQTKNREDATSEVSNDLESQINAIKGGGQPLAESERAFFEPRFGADFSQVKVHTGAQAAESTQAVNAKAYTLGQDVVFGGGQYAPEATEGKKLLAHELTHVVQQDAVKQDSSVRFRPALIQGRVSRAIQRAIQIPAAVLAALAVAGRLLLSCIIGAAFGVGLDYALQRGIAWWRNQTFRWNTCFAIISGIIGCVSAGVGSAISRALFRSTGGHLERNFATRAVVWLLTWLYGRFPIWPIAAILKKLVSLGCVNASELPPGVQAE